MKTLSPAIMFPFHHLSSKDKKNKNKNKTKKTIILAFSLDLSFLQSSRISSAAQLLLGEKRPERSRALAAAGRHPEPSFLRCLAVA